MKKPKMHYDVLSDGVYWEDEGLENCDQKLIDIFKLVIHYRTALLVNYSKKEITKEEAKLYKVFKMAKKDFPNWIGFNEKRCSYNPYLSDRIKRIRKASAWKMAKRMNEDWESQKEGDNK
ncbi:MAG: hypothetical protein JXQ93_00345 [Flavobacteriaceae bacterium]